MSENTSLIPKNGTCPVCHSMLLHIPPYYNCNDCLSVFKFVDYAGYGEEDVLVRLLNPKEDV